MVAALTLGCLATLPSPAADTPVPTVELRWALGAQPAGNGKTSGIDKDMQLADGTRLKFLVEPKSPASVYLILLDSGNNLEVLYRETAGPSGADPAYLPPGGRWFELDDEAGRETFFLLASVEPLTALDELLAEHAAATPDTRGAVVERVVAEIRRLHRANRNFARPVEKPVMIGGQVRGLEPGTQAIDRLAVEISAERFYGKTITLDH